MDTINVDVLVIGAGLAGMSAAAVAARGGAKVMLAHDRARGSSSFSKSTWGLGMVTESHEPKTRASESLFKALCDVGMDMNTPSLGKVLVERSEEALALLESMGATILSPQNPSQREFVACFDHVPRSWHGFVGRSSRTAMEDQLRRLGVFQFDDCAFVLTLLRDDAGTVCGAILVRRTHSPSSTLHNLYGLSLVTAKTTILATGGTCGLFAHHLCPPSSLGQGHVLALDAGCRLRNMEFQQLMLGFERVCEDGSSRTFVYNEKLYRWSRFQDASKRDAFEDHGIDAATASRALEAHSWHGPYTRRLASHLVDETLSAGTSDGLPYQVVYDDALRSGEVAEFIRTYLDWLDEQVGPDANALDSVPVHMYAHSSNGGIAIDERCRTGVEGLLACGECAGGVHGVDRIGGLASLTAATFGLIAGEEALERLERAVSAPEGLRPCSPFLIPTVHNFADLAVGVDTLLDDTCMVNRDGIHLEKGKRLLIDRLGQLGRISEKMGLDELSSSCVPPISGQEALRGACEGHEVRARLLASLAIVVACLRRRESRGSHHRVDFPTCDPRQAYPRDLVLDDLFGCSDDLAAGKDAKPSNE